MARIELEEGNDSFDCVIGKGLYAPRIASAAGAFSLAAYAHSRLALREFEAARIRIAQINGCQICQTWRSLRDARVYLEKAHVDPTDTFVSRGEPPDEGFYSEVANWRSSPVFSQRERIAVEYADRFALDHLSLQTDEALWKNMHLHFSDDEIVDLTLCIGAWIAMGRFAQVLGIDGVCALPSTNHIHASAGPRQQPNC